MSEPCELETEVFTCCKCGKEFNHTEGTWLLIGTEEPNFMKPLSGDVDNPPQVFAWDMRKPEVITSPDFTCYDCAN